jgi:hypothetical protein
MPLSSSDASLQRPWYVHEVRRSTPLVSGGVVRYASLGTTELGEEDLALGVRKGLDITQHGADHCIAHFGEVMRLLVVTLTRGQEWVERLLPVHERMGADHIGNRVTDRP